MDRSNPIFQKGRIVIALVLNDASASQDSLRVARVMCQTATQVVEGSCVVTHPDEQKADCSHNLGVVW